MDINRDYMTTNGSYSWNDPRYVCIHYTGGAGRARGETARNNAIYYAREGGRIQCGAHYFVGDDGIYASTPEDRGAWTQGNYDANHACISIEVVGSDGEGFSETEVAYLAQLVPDIMARHGIQADHVIRHHDVADVFTGRPTTDPHKRCPADYIDWGAWQALRDRITNKIGDMTMFQYGLIHDEFGKTYLWTGSRLCPLETAEEYLTMKAHLESDGSDVPVYTMERTNVETINAICGR